MAEATSSRRYDLFFFFLIAFGWTWALNLPRILDSFEVITLPFWLSETLKYIAVFGPSVAAFALTAIRTDKEGVGQLFKRGFDARFRKIWLIPTLLLMPVSGLITWILLAIFGQLIPWEYSLPPAMIVPIGLLIWLMGALPEEYGWRGYALDRLQARWNPIISSLILGLLWGIWHLPLHFIEGTTQFYIPISEFIVQTVLLAFLYTWLHNNTGGSVLVASLFHFAGNLTGALIPYWPTTIGRWISILPLFITLVFVLVSGGLSAATGRKQVQR